MSDMEGQDLPRGRKPEVADLAEALELMKGDTSRFLSDLLKGISMWAFTSAMAFALAGAWLALALAVLSYAHPYGAPPLILDILYLSYGFAVGSAALGVLLFWRYYSLRNRYTRLFEIARKLR